MNRFLRRALRASPYAIAAIAGILLPEVALAAGGGGTSMPYSSWIQTFKQSVQGEIAQIISLCVVVGGVAGWIISGQLEGLLQIIIRIGIGIAIIVGAAAFITSISSSGALL